MNYLRELLYRPKRSDKSLMARFYFADVNLNSVAAELDSFDGRKDPERCSCLVTRLRSCQDKLLHICNKMLEEIEPGLHNRARAFRAKFPDDIITDNLSGQLWFGAECLAAGSSIMNKERESELMRPLAKAVTKSLEKVRALLREQCLTPQPEYTEKIRENLKIFDRLFAEFEFSYVQCMVHVKTIKEYELHQDLIVLFSDTLHRAIRNEMVTQEMVDLYEPSLMFAIPRLAIVYGLLICPEGPLNVDRSSSDFPELFLPFRNLLRKIRELLLTLAMHEVLVLEMLLCQHEEPANITVKLKEVEHMLMVMEKSEEGKVQADKLTEKLCDTPSCDKNRQAMARSIVDDLVAKAVKVSLKRQAAASAAAAASATIEIDCTTPEIKVSPHHKHKSGSREERHSSESHDTLQPLRDAAGSGSVPSVSHTREASASGDLCYSPRPKQKLRRHNAKRDTKRIPLRYQKDRRARFKSTEDLLHRLYVCISGAADQLQSNYASDFRAILRNVFLINVSSDDVEENEDEEDDQTDHASVAAAQADSSPSGDAAISASSPALAEAEASVSSSAAPSSSSSRRSLPTSYSLPIALAVDLGTDALQHELSRELCQEQLRTCSTEDLSDGGHGNRVQGVTMGVAYAQNLDMRHLQEQEEIAERGAARLMQQQQEFFQSEPTLLNIASGSPDNLPVETLGREAEYLYRAAVESPPPWVPDELAPNCMGCACIFTIFKRRHHCRGCGLVYCNRCSSHSMALPRYGMERPVRVCNRCVVIYQYPDMNTNNAANMNRSPWTRNFGMVS